MFAAASPLDYGALGVLAIALGAIMKAAYDLLNGRANSKHVIVADDQASMATLNERLDNDNEKLRHLLDLRDDRIDKQDKQIAELTKTTQHLRIRVAELLAEQAHMAERLSTIEIKVTAPHPITTEQKVTP